MEKHNRFVARIAARKRRNNPTDAESKLWDTLSERQLGWKFRRQALIVAGICVDFYCPLLKVVILIDGAEKMIKTLTHCGYRVVSVHEDDVLRKINKVLCEIAETMCISVRESRVMKVKSPATKIKRTLMRDALFARSKELHAGRKVK